MGELHDERREKARFITSGEAEIEFKGSKLRGVLLDLSINGLRMSRPEGFAVSHHSRFPITLYIAGISPLTADVALVRMTTDIIGVEFMDMPPRDFAFLASAIERFVELRAQALLDTVEQ